MALDQKHKIPLNPKHITDYFRHAAGGDPFDTGLYQQ